MSTVAIDWLSVVFPLECNTIAETDTPLFPLECNTIVETDTPLGNSAHSKQHMWQSQVEIELYSVADFNLITVFEALKCKTFIKGAVTLTYSCIYAAHIRPALNRSSAL